MFTESVSYSAALLAGFLSFLSPCVLPLIPAYLTFLTGSSIEEITEGKDAAIRKKLILSTVSYVLGFSFVFILMGASASYIGGFMLRYSSVIRIVGGVIIIVLGLHLAGLIPIQRLYFEKRIILRKKPLHFLGTFLVGMAFGAGWSPCIGPLLGSILILAGNQDTVREGIMLLAVYSSGLAIPFILMSVFINFFFRGLKKAVNVMKYVNIAAGILLIIVGVTLITNKFNILL